MKDFLSFLIITNCSNDSGLLPGSTYNKAQDIKMYQWVEIQTTISSINALYRITQMDILYPTYDWSIDWVTALLAIYGHRWLLTEQC